MWLLIGRTMDPDAWVGALPLKEGALTLGRDPGCDVVVPGQKVSRRHAEIRRQGSKVTFRDLGSSVGVLLDGVRTDEGILTPGSTLTIQRTTLRLVAKMPLGDETDESSLAGDAGSWEHFGSFVATLTRATDARTLLQRLLMGLLGLVRMERGFVLLSRGGSSEKLVPVAVHNLAKDEDLIGVSSTIYGEALRSGSTVVIADTRSDERCVGAASLAGSAGPRMVVCGPLAAGGETFGVIYLDGPVGPRTTEAMSAGLFQTMTGLASRLLAAGATRQRLVESTERQSALRALAWEAEPPVFGESPAGVELRRLVTAAARQDVTVLVTGETGTGKEMVARALHHESPRRDGPFVAVNCAALPRELIEAELFGVERGAYTGASERRLGRFELASGGTLFLDEVGELPAEMQVKLLRTLQERVVTRIGGADPIPVDFRLVCATNADLERCVREGSFRQDFYYRINVFRVELVPLRGRREDILPLAHHFLAQLGTRFGRSGLRLAPDAERVLTDYPWPGNVRELRNVIERAVVICRGDTVGRDELPLSAALRVRSTAGDPEAPLWEALPADYQEMRETVERVFLRRSISENNGNLVAVSRATGMARTTLYRRLAQLGIQPGGEE